MVAIGPAVGVGSLVVILGLSDSARRDVDEAFRQLGSNLVVVQMAGGPTTPLPEDAALRAMNVSVVEAVSDVAVLTSPEITTFVEQSGRATLAATFGVRAARPGLPDVLGVEPHRGRFLNSFDEEYASPAVVMGAEAARFFAVDPALGSTVYINGTLFGVVGVLPPIAALPEFDRSLFITFAAATTTEGHEVPATQLFVRAESGGSRDAARGLPLALSLGAQPVPVTLLPGDLIAAGETIDATLRAIVVTLAMLALFIGGLGIANVMAVAVLQRSGEIGIRRAMGHPSFAVAGQFVLEAVAIGLIGAALGVLGGTAFLLVATRALDWTLELQVWPYLLGSIGAVAVAALAGLYPAWLAIRVEPLEALRRA